MWEWYRHLFKEEHMSERKTIRQKLLGAVVVASIFGLVPLRDADGQCGCSVCGCYRTHPVTQECNMPSLEPCDCWLCMT